MQWCDRMLLNGQSQINHAHHWERQKKKHTMNEVGNCVSVSLWHTRSIKSWRLVWRVFTCCDDDFFSLLHETPLTNGSSRSSTINFSSLIFGIGLPLLLSIDSSFFWGVDRMYGAVNWHHFLSIWRPLATPFNKFADSLICHHSRSDDEWTIDKEGVSACVCVCAKAISNS